MYWSCFFVGVFWLFVGCVFIYNGEYIKSQPFSFAGYFSIILAHIIRKISILESKNG